MIKFDPVDGSTKSITTSTSSGRVALATGGNHVLVQNTDATDFVYIKLGGSGVEADTVDLPLLPLGSIVLPLSDHTYLAAEAAANTPVVKVTNGWVTVI